MPYTTIEAASPRFDATPPQHHLVTRLQAIETKLSELAAERAAIIESAVSDLDWMDIPYVRTVLKYDAEIKAGDLVHINEAHFKDGKVHGPDGHRVEDCNGLWCRKLGATRWTRGKNALGFKHLGTFRALAKVEYHWICVDAN